MKMKTSTEITNIAKSLLEAQKKITFAAKDSTNPHYKSKYANLEGVIEAVKGPLNDNGIVFIQTFSDAAPGYIAITTRLLHVSGEWVEDTTSIPLQKNDAQGYGSSATYGRRYFLSAITGLFQADDDGEEGSKSHHNSNTTPVKATPSNAASDAPRAGNSTAQLAADNTVLSVSDAKEVPKIIWAVKTAFKEGDVKKAYEECQKIKSSDIKLHVWAGLPSDVRSAITNYAKE